MPALIESDDALLQFVERLVNGQGPVALDAERASGFRYSQRAYLIQIRRAGAGTALIDPIAVTRFDALADALSDTEWILHAATQDLPCLAELGLTPDGLFDTELAGRLLGRERVGLSALMESELGAHLEKGHGATDWSQRPLTAAQLRYAALDVELLIELRDHLDGELTASGKREWAQQEFDALLGFRARERTEEDWRRTSGVHRVRKPRALAVVRELWRERDTIASDRDIAVSRLLPDSALVAVAAASTPAAGSTPVRTAEDLMGVQGFHGRGARRYLKRWFAAYQRALSLPDDQLPTQSPRAEGPPPPRSWADRNPAAFQRLSAARSALASEAETLHLPVENLLTPDLVRRMCWDPPAEASVVSVAEALGAAGARPWQVEHAAPLLAQALADTPTGE